MADKSPVAVYAGSFDPITNGHLDIIRRALSVFDRLHVAVVDNPNKKTLFNIQERVNLVKEAVGELSKDLSSRVVVSGFSGLLVDYVKQLNCSVIIRGLRAISDYEYEAQMAVINRHLDSEIETVFLVTSDHCSFISSSIVREIAKLGGEVGGLVPKAVAKRLKEVYSSAP